MKVKRFDHVSIAVHNLDQAINTFSRLFNLNGKDRRKVRHLGAENAFIPLSNGSIELMQPLKDPGAPDDVKKTLDRKGEGMMNLCLTVDNVEKFAGHIKACGARIIEGKDADGDKIIYVHPKDVHGVLIELRTGERKIKNT
jgi:methylmalonyl-CoA/ethylmalonyl-CoA epimerase